MSPGMIEGPAGPDRLVLPRLGDLDLDPRVVVEPLGELGRERRAACAGRSRSRRSRGKAREQLLQGLHAAGAHAADDDPLTDAGAG